MCWTCSASILLLAVPPRLGVCSSAECRWCMAAAAGLGLGTYNLRSLSTACLPRNAGAPSQHLMPCARSALVQVTGRCVPLASLSRGSPLEDEAAREQQGQEELAALQGALEEQPPTCWEVRGAHTARVPFGLSACCAVVWPDSQLCCCTFSRPHCPDPLLPLPADCVGLLPAQHSVAVGAAAI